MKKLENKIAIITAASQGIGFSCADLMAEHGAKVYIGVFSEEEARPAIKKIREKGNQAEYVYFNGKEKLSAQTMIEDVLKKEDHIDILVNNFGITDSKTDLDLLNGSSDTFFATVNQNLGSVYYASKAAIPSMIKVGGGSIINISSIGSVVPDFSRLGYVVSKAAINSLTQQIALQYGNHNVRCNAVLPSMVATASVKNNMPQEFIDSFLKHVPLHRIGQPEDIAKAVLYFASDDSSYVTGQLQEVTGGYALGTPQYAEINELSKHQ